jgi:hypothetical protein
MLKATTAICAHLRIDAATLKVATWITGRRRLSLLKRGCCIQSTNGWGPAADELWERTRSKFSWICDHSSAFLNWRYRSDDYRRVHVRGPDGAYLGWAVCKLRQIESNPYFGSLRIGTIVDFLADPENEEAACRTLAAAASTLIESGAEMTICNLSDLRYRSAIRRLGFWRGPSNYLFLVRSSDPIGGAALEFAHLTRGDSDGDYNL